MWQRPHLAAYGALPDFAPPRQRRSRGRARLAAVIALTSVSAAIALASDPHATASRSPAPHAPFAVGLRFEVFVDRSRTIRLPSGARVPRTLVTEVRYPARGSARATDTRDAPAASAAGPFPLIVFGHGFDVTPGTYTALMRSWARAGFVVAAPVFPLANPRAPGGPTEADLPNEPADMSFVISQVLAASASARSAFHGLVDRAQIAVAGQSDGGEAALAAAYDPRFRDGRVRAAMILSGAEIPQLGTLAFPQHGPPLLAAQGSADSINPPSLTAAFFDAAHAPKYLLTLIGASHLPPYTSEQPQLAIVERVTAAFVDFYVEGHASARGALATAGDVPGIATLRADP
jgi:predicted dienelactone hydrolase